MKTDDLIAQLSEAEVGYRPLSLKRLMLEWIVVAAASIAMCVITSGVRPDLQIRFGELLFTAELTSNLLLAAVAACWMLQLSLPDRAHQRTGMIISGLLFAAYSVVCFISAQPETSPEVDHGHSMECLVCLIGFSVLPAAWTMWRVRSLASVRPALAGLMGILMSASLGALCVRLVESEQGTQGFLLWHYAPLIVLSISGLWLGKKIFKW